MRLHAVILAGGRGERFWPLSRRNRPKQFLPFFSPRSLLQETAARLEGWVDRESLWVVASADLMRDIRRQLGDSLAPGCCLVEPVPRNTGAAIGVAAAAIEARDPGATMLVLPSDHWIPDVGLFHSDVERTAEAAASHGGLHLFGIPIAWPSTGYGYIEEGDPLVEHPGIAQVARFHEKPDAGRAVAYARNPRMLWNSGIFIWRASVILEALSRHAPDLGERLLELQQTMPQGTGPPDATLQASLDRVFREAPDESIDKLVLERHHETYVTRAGFRWSDLGTWFSWGALIDPDAAGNRRTGVMLLRDAHDCIAYSEGGLLALMGVKDLVVVRLPDVTLVCAKERAQEVRQLLEEARARGDLDAYL